MALPRRIRASKSRAVWRVIGACIAGLIAGFGGPSPARAQVAGRARLAWKAASGCPSQAAAGEALHSLLGAPSSTTAPAALVDVVITRDGPIYTARITFGGALQGDRRLSGRSCSTLSHAVLLITALTIDPLAAADTITQARREGRTPSRRVRVQLGVHMGADLGTLPRATVGPAIEVGVELGLLRVAAETTWWVPQLKLGNDERGGRMGLMEGGIRGCLGLLRVDSVDAGPCVALSAGRYWGRGSGDRLTSSEYHTLPWLASRLGISVRQRGESVFLEASLEAGLTIVGPRYTIDDALVFEPSWFGRLALGFGWRL
jgi:hypothetical protein